MNEQNPSSKNDEFANIWITSKVRMEAHSRYKHLDLLSHLVLTTYSVILLGFSVFGNQLADTSIGKYQTELSIFFSLCVLSASLVIWGLRFGQLANDHRECYLKLHSLYHSDISANEKNEKYHQILERYPNHSDFDSERMLYKKIVVAKGTVTGTCGDMIFDWPRKLRYYKIVTFRFLFQIFVMFAPLIPLAVLYVIT